MKYEKMSAGLCALVDEYQRHGAAGMSTEMRAIPLAADEFGGAPKVAVFLRCREDATFDHLPGVAINAIRGTIRTAQVALDSLDDLSEEESVHHLSPSRQLKLLCDFAAGKTNLPSFKSSQNPPLTGRGVIVGVVDSGIDPGHPSFAGRILSIWDQTISGQGWGTTNYGTVLTGPTMVVSSDTNGHGTHVAGIAAGQHAQFNGVAHEADLIIVKTNFQFTSIADGIRYVFAEAERLGRPAVVNLSLGAHFDPHDGTDDLSEIINQESGPGRIVVAAAGNEGTDDIHAEAIIPSGQTADIELRVPPTSQSGATPWALLNGWYAVGGDCEIGIRTSSGDATPFQPVIANGSPTRTYAFANAVVRVTTPPTTATVNGDHQFQVQLLPGQFGAVVQGGTWRLAVRNNGANDVRVNVWSNVPSEARGAAFLAPFNSGAMKIGSPGCAAEAITVASYTTRNAWVDSTGASQGVGLQVDALSDFSSPGPLRNGAPKPDVAAPGAMIIAARSHQSAPRPKDIIDADFRVNAGTSMACPFVAGLIALLLQRDPTFQPAAIKTLLQNNSRIPNQPPLTFDPQWGHGLIDASGL